MIKILNAKYRLKTAGMALKGQYNLASIIVPPEVSMKEKFSQKRKITKKQYLLLKS